MSRSSAGVIRAARSDEAALLSEIAFRSKAYWGYSEEFMVSCREELTVTADFIDANPSFVCEDEGGVIGYYTLERRSTSRIELEHMFVEPTAIGRGYGRQLMDHAIRQARAAGYRVLAIQADPNAERFYLSRGAIRVGTEASHSIPDRVLPLLELDCQVGEFRLVRPSIDFRNSFTEMALELESEGDARYSLALSDFEAYLANSQKWATGANLPPDRVRMDEWWLVDAARVLGGCRLRHRLNPALELDGGHVGYDIRPSERRRGYGHRILDLVLEKAASAGLDRVLITCETTNRASARIIESAGGSPTRNAISPNTGNEMHRFWVSLSDPGPDSRPASRATAEATRSE
ncbi:MAG: GNAT family N-acetyltransferase [Myxococcota bacterium]